MGFEIGQVLEQYLKAKFPKRSTLLEIGSGEGTHRLSSHFNMISIEDNPYYVDKFNSLYLYVPLSRKTHWYEVTMLEAALDQFDVSSYDAILVDAPRAVHGNDRMGFLHNLDMFDTSVPIFIDDTHRQYEHELAEQVAQKLDRKAEFFTDGEKGFAAIW